MSNEPILTEDGAEIPRPKRAARTAPNQVTVFSGLHYPIGGTIWTELDNGEVDGRQWSLAPGDNFMDEDLWKIVKELPGVIARMDTGHIKPAHESTIHDAEMLLAPAPRSYIRLLSAKAQRIQDGQLFGVEGGKGASPEARLRALEAKIRQLTTG